MPQEWQRPAFEKALAKLRELGAEVIEVDMDDCDVLIEYDDVSKLTMNSECKSHLRDYLQTLEK